MNPIGNRSEKNDFSSPMERMRFADQIGSRLVITAFRPIQIPWLVTLLTSRREQLPSMGYSSAADEGIRAYDHVCQQYWPRSIGFADKIAWSEANQTDLIIDYSIWRRRSWKRRETHIEQTRWTFSEAERKMGLTSIECEKGTEKEREKEQKATDRPICPCID